MTHTYRLVMSCPDQVGIVAKVSQCIADLGGWISDANHHSDTSTGWFFMRHEILAQSLNHDLDQFKKAFSPIADGLGMQWSIKDSQIKKRVAIFASQQSHCLSDLLHRWKEDELNCEIACVISNHEKCRDLVSWHDIPYHLVSITPDNKDNAFKEIGDLLTQYQIETSVLARFMQILPPELCQQYKHNIINIHHSSLPSFKGAKPYHQAFERGVKLVGATCHYVTDQLDEGPIIEQDVIRISHRDTLEEIIRSGKDVERTVLARGLRYHLDDRVVVHGTKTVIL